MYPRRKTNSVKTGTVVIGGDAPISIQSMTNTDTHSLESTLNQVLALERAGADIIRISVPDVECADIFSKLKKNGVKAPLVADIHFDYKIALAALEGGADKIRINPGNIGSLEKVREVARACMDRGVPIRVGVNSGSTERNLLLKYGGPTPEALAESALYHAAILESVGFYDTVLSVKASTTKDMIAANRILAERCSYALHLGVTEAGAGDSALIKSSVGIGALLSEGIGDTVRVSLTDDPVKEVYAAKAILSSLGLKSDTGMDIVSCPTCARTKINLIGLYREFSDRVKLEGLDSMNIKVALMGCAVNGPGEAREADIGVAGGLGEGLLFKKGEIIRKIREDRLIDELILEIKNIKEQGKND